MVAVALVSLVGLLILKILRVRRVLSYQIVFLEVTPPSQTEITREATQRFFSVLHGLRDGRTLLDKLLGHQVSISLEVTSAKAQGVRYIIGAPTTEMSNIESSIVTYIPNARIKHITNEETPEGRVLSIKQKGHFAYPIRDYQMYEQHDPIAYLTGAMTKLKDDELMSFQMVISPVKVREANSIAKRIFHNEELLYRLGRRHIPIIGGIFNLINGILFSILDSIGEGVSSTHRTQKPQQSIAQHKQQAAMKIKPARVLSAFEQQLAEAVHSKLNQALYRVDMRVLIAVKPQNESKRIKGVREWLAVFSVPKYQSLKIRYSFPAFLRSKYSAFCYNRRIPSLFRRSSAIFSSGEVADLYHFPNSQVTKTENIAKSLSKTLAAPISLKGTSDFDIILGRNHHHGASTDIGLTKQERERHVYIIGGTGNGKTTLMLYKMVQSLKNHEGMAFIDPHGDAAQTLLHYIPKSRIDDVIYFNPDDLAHPIGLNLLELTPGLSGDELLREKDVVTESAISVFRKIFSEDDSGGHRIEYVLRNAIQTALTTEEPTIFTIFRLLNDAKYRKKVVAELEDEDLKSFWKNELGKAGEFQRVKMSAGITAKVGRFLFSASAKRILEQPKSTIDFDDLLNSGKILICNFSKGLLGEDTSELFGITVLAKLQLAALRRARVEQASRRPFYLYVDEFQNFATMSFVQMLSEARKYKLFLTMAEQSTSQQEDQQMVNTILANVGTVICFRTGNPADERLLLPLFAPYVEQGDIANLPAYNFYARLAAVKSQEPVSGETLLLDDEGSQAIANKVRAASQKNYAIRYKPQPRVTKNKKKPEGKKTITKAKATKRKLPDA